MPFNPLNKVFVTYLTNFDNPFDLTPPPVEKGVGEICRFLKCCKQAIPNLMGLSYLGRRIPAGHKGFYIDVEQPIAPVDLVVHSPLDSSAAAAALAIQYLEQGSKRKIQVESPRAWLYGQQEDINRGLSQLVTTAENRGAHHLLLLGHPGTGHLIAQALGTHPVDARYIKEVLTSNYEMAAMTFYCEDWDLVRKVKMGMNPLDGPYTVNHLKGVHAEAVRRANSLVKDYNIPYHELSSWLEPRPETPIGNATRGGLGASGAVESTFSSIRMMTAADDNSSKALRRQ